MSWVYEVIISYPGSHIIYECFLFFQTGAAIALGEQPIKGLLNPEAGARMSVGEALTNLVFAPISDLKVSYKKMEKRTRVKNESVMLESMK